MKRACHPRPVTRRIDRLAWFADHRQHGEGATTIGLELVDATPSFDVALIAFGGARWHRRESS